MLYITAKSKHFVICKFISPFFICFINIYLSNLNGCSCILVSKQEIEQRLCKMEKPCPYYSKCEIDQVSFYPKCACRDECNVSDFKSALSRQPHKFYNLSDKDLLSKMTAPLCGTDGENYSNFCDLKKTSCKLKKDIEVYVRFNFF